MRPSGQQVVEAASQRHRVDHQPPPVGKLEHNDLSRLPPQSGQIASTFGGSESGSRPNQRRASSIAWRRSSSATPCLKAERWISTRRLLYDDNPDHARASPTKLCNLCATRSGKSRDDRGSTGPRNRLVKLFSLPLRPVRVAFQAEGRGFESRLPLYEVPAKTQLFARQHEIGE